ncbi:urease accessory protein UreD [Amaricoccus sp.]|uniref:urease accessory protein UreD n=1 Tax=Amaricoccus sp. TaxID=1872485 RepID=UPI001B59F99D|nr:urease accessory protein UreD [Amaricoccus sp.]MBP7003405.1 urease accessory protein UreD [Amaricoccus sp.]
MVAAPSADRAAAPLPPPFPEPERWRAELELWFETAAGKTRLMRRRHLGPLAVQRPFHPEPDGAAHVYLLHPPGGVAGGDRLEIACHVAPGARALLTTPGATKFYRSAGRPAEARTRIDVGPGAICEHLPQETILFDGADASIATRVDLAPDAAYVGWDLLSLGRPAAGERFASGRLGQRVEIFRDGRPIWFERLALAGGSPLLDAPFALAGRPLVGAMVYTGPLPETAAERIRAATGDAEAARVFSVSQLEHVLVCRYLGARMSEGKALFAAAWAALRSAALGKPAIPPRIWST